MGGERQNGKEERGEEETQVLWQEGAWKGGLSAAAPVISQQSVITVQLPA